MADITISAAVLPRLERGDRIRHPSGFERTLVRRKRPDEMGYPGWQLNDSGGVSDDVLVDVGWSLITAAGVAAPEGDDTDG